VTVLAGQNESGKSSILHALRDYEEGKFDEDSLPFSTGGDPIQSVSCTYKVEPSDNFYDVLVEQVLIDFKLSETDDSPLLRNNIDKVLHFTVTKTNEAGVFRTEIDTQTFNLFKSSIALRPAVTASLSPSAPVPESSTTDAEVLTPRFVVSDQDNGKVADLFWSVSPKIIFFDDFCDLLPDKIFISDLEDEVTTANGYTAVMNLQKILNTSFIDKDKEKDAVRGVKADEQNKTLSIDFQKDWGQRIHGENEVKIKYVYEKRVGEGENGSYINFFVETKEHVLLTPKQRSKGLIWFLSLWLEIMAQDKQHDNLVLLLDEPDQHLHVRAQNDMLKLINKLASKSTKQHGDQIIYATHSPYLIEIDHLSRIRLVINDDKAGTTVEDIATSKIDTEYRRDALKPIADAIGLSVGAFSTLGEKNVLVEGVSDHYYLTAMKKVLGRSGDYHFIPGIGVRQINNLISLCIGYGLNWVAVIDDDPAVGGKDTKKKFDEIRDHVFDGDQAKTEEKVYILSGAAGIENMFTVSDLKLIDPRVKSNTDMVKVVGKKRKILFSRLFFEKVQSNDIKIANLSSSTVNNFKKVFDFIDLKLV
jgi:hypothetical protein